MQARHTVLNLTGCQIHILNRWCTRVNALQVIFNCFFLICGTTKGLSHLKYGDGDQSCCSAYGKEINLQAFLLLLFISCDSVAYFRDLGNLPRLLTQNPEPSTFHFMDFLILVKFLRKWVLQLWSSMQLDLLYTVFNV